MKCPGNIEEMYVVQVMMIIYFIDMKMTLIS